MFKKIAKLIWKCIDNIVKLAVKFLDDILLLTGISLLAKGVFLIYIPAGYITLGICFIAFAFFIARKGG